jgi:hypothetical protein
MLAMKISVLRILELSDDASPFHDIIAQEFIELLSRHRHRHSALLARQFDDPGALHDSADGGI